VRLQSVEQDAARIQSALLGGQWRIRTEGTAGLKARRTPDFLERFAAHLRESAECERWAAEAVRLEAAGKKKQAVRAKKKAEACMRAMMKLEGKLWAHSAATVAS
jgi:hypothetical protein